MIFRRFNICDNKIILCTKQIHRFRHLKLYFFQQVLQHYIDIWSSNQTEQEFKQVLDSICRTLGQPDRIKRCLHIVDDYYIPFFDYLIHELNPRAACQTVGLCGSNGFLQVSKIILIIIQLTSKIKYKYGSMGNKILL